MCFTPQYLGDLAQRMHYNRISPGPPRLCSENGGRILREIICRTLYINKYSSIQPFLNFSYPKDVELERSPTERVKRIPVTDGNR